MKFKNIDEIVEWLELMEYETFWKEIKPFCLIMLSHEKCDADIASGATDKETVLYVMKNFARMELTSILKLEWRTDVPMMSVH